jgi:hypothetical protein
MVLLDVKTLKIGVNKEDIWELIITALCNGEAMSKDKLLLVALRGEDWGRVKLNMYVESSHVGEAVFNGTFITGINLTNVLIRMFGDRSERRSVLERYIRESGYFDSKRNPKEGGYKLDIPKESRLFKSVETSKARFDGKLLPYIHPRVGIVASRERGIFDIPDCGDECEEDERDYD